MERVVVYYLNGNVKEFNEPLVQISGGSLIISTKKVDSDDNQNAFLITTNEVIDLSKISNFVKITPTKKFNIEENVSNE